MLRGLDMVVLTRPLLDDAGFLQPANRSPDATHLIAALRAGDTLHAIVTFDHQMLSGAAYLGIAAVSSR